MILFFAGWPAPKVAVIAGALLLITRRVNPQKIYRQIDWSLLVMFIGLFIVIAGIEKTHLAADLFAWVSRYHLERPAPLSLFAAVLSNLVSNVPAVMVFKSFIPRLADPARAWLVLAASSTLAGNLTVLGLGGQSDRDRAEPQPRCGSRFGSTPRPACRWPWQPWPSPFGCCRPMLH